MHTMPRTCSHAWHRGAATIVVIAITGVAAFPALARAQHVAAIAHAPARAPLHQAVRAPSSPQTFSGAVLNGFESSLQASTDGATFGKQAIAQSAPQYATSAPGQSATIPVTLRWTALGTPIQPSDGETLKLLGYAVFRADPSRSAWDSVAFTAQPTISVSAPVSPHDNALFRVAPVYQETGLGFAHGAPSTGTMAIRSTYWTADTTAAVRVITR